MALDRDTVEVSEEPIGIAVNPGRCRHIPCGHAGDPQNRAVPLHREDRTVAWWYHNARIELPPMDVAFGSIGHMQGQMSGQRRVSVCDSVPCIDARCRSIACRYRPPGG